uniref:Chromosome 11 open reading frame 1 n=1 Tax=Accipiter nisus TaxID=211598 RepID=A0A8B9MQ28_9AVES
ITYKFSQYGWRCTTNENDYSTKTLIGNWNEKQHYIPENCAAQYTHCFETTYSSDYNKGKHQGIKKPHWFPGHHPELEPPSFNPTAQSCYTIDYRPPYATFSLLVSNSQRRNKKDARNVTEMERICTLCLLKNRRPLCQQCYKDILQAKRPVTH